jgi:hypothetical protein
MAWHETTSKMLMGNDYNQTSDEWKWQWQQKSRNGRDTSVGVGFA